MHHIHPLSKKTLKQVSVLIWNGEKCDLKWFSVIQNGPNRTSKIICNGEKCIRKWISVIQNGRRQPFCEKKHCVLIWNGEKCDRKWFSVIQNGRREPFCENKFKKKSNIDLKWREMRSKVIFGHPKWPPAAILWKRIKVVYWYEMAINAIESDFRSSKMGGGGRGQ